jgi:hypothetical protein
VTDTIPAVVGSFPEPFVDGRDGKRLPVTLECASDAEPACERVASELRTVRVPFSRRDTGATPGGLVVLVGTWADLRADGVAALIDRGPAASGVYAEFGSRGQALRLLDPRGQTVRRLRAGAGLVAATASGQADPTWVVTGTDRVGVATAATAMTPAALDGHFALAVTAGARIPVPLEGNS